MGVKDTCFCEVCLTGRSFLVLEILMGAALRPSPMATEAKKSRIVLRINTIVTQYVISIFKLRL